MAAGVKSAKEKRQQELLTASIGMVPGQVKIRLCVTQDTGRRSLHAGQLPSR